MMNKINNSVLTNKLFNTFISFKLGKMGQFMMWQVNRKNFEQFVLCLAGLTDEYCNYYNYFTQDERDYLKKILK